ALGDVALVVGGDPLQATNCNRFRLDSPAPAGRLAGAIARPSEYPRKDVGLPVDHVGVGISPFGDQPDVLRHRCVRRARPLTIDDLVEVLWRLGVRRLQLSTRPFLSSPPPPADLTLRHRYSHGRASTAG